MELYAKLGRAADIKRALSRTRGWLSEGLDAEPADETSTLKTNLMRQLTKSSEGAPESLSPTTVRENAES